VKIADGKLYLVAGNGSAGTATGTDGDGGLATSATLNGPRSVASDAAGNIYIADTADNRIRKVLNPASGLPGAGTIQTIAGTGTSSSTGDGGLATAATISNPQGVLVDGSGNVYMAEASHVRAICVTCAAGSGLYNLLKNLGFAAPVNGDIYTLAGTASATNTALAPGPGNTVNMGPQKLGIDADGNIYIADSTNNVVWFEDGRTGYTQIIAGGGTAASCGGSAIGDGCAATQAVIGSNGGNGEGATVDQQGNLYIADSTNLRIRKVSNNLKFSPTPVGTAATQTVKLHFTPGDTPTAITLSSPDFSLGTGACTTNSDTTSDCIYTAIFNPVVAGPRTAPISLTTSLNNPAYLGFSGTGQGAGATVDPATQLTFGTNLTVNAMATDNSANVYVADGTSKSVLEFAPGTTGIGAGVSAAFKTLGTFNNPSAVAVDSIGDVYVADASTGLVTQISPSGTSKALTTGFTSPMGLVVDALNNLYVSDASAKSITEVGSNFSATRVIANTGLVSPAGLAIDANANVYVTDPAASAVYLYNAQSNTRTIATTAAVAPRSVAVDAAGNLLIADSASGSILAVPSNSASATFTVASNLKANTVALDSVGNLYTASAGGQVLELERTQGLTTFSRANNAPIVVNLLSTGNVAASLSATDPDQTNFSLTLTPSTNCAMTTTISIVIGGTCQFTSQFAPGSATNFFNTVTLSGNAANAALATPATLELMQTGMNAPYPDTIALGSLSPSSPIYGQTVTVAVSVTSTDGSPTGTVQLLVDGASSGSPITLNAGAAALHAANTSTQVQHAIGANYSGDSSFASGSAATLCPSRSLPSPLPLSFASIPAETFGNAAFLISATSASAGALTYSVVSGPATLSGASVTLTGRSTVIRFRHAGCERQLRLCQRSGDN
jgi:sugar lactone lactonase YvrE